MRGRAVRDWRKHLRVLHLLKTGTGGTWAVRQVRELVALGVEVHVCAPRGPRTQEYKQVGAVVHVDDVAATPAHPTKWWGRIRRCAELVRAVKPAIVHSHFVATTLTMRLALSAVPVARVFQVPGPLHLEYGPFRRLDVVSAGQHDWWIASCEWTRRAYLRSGVEPSRVFLAYYGLDSEWFDASPTGGLRRELGIDDARPLVGMIAHMYPPKRYLGQRQGLKGHEDLIDAVALCAEQVPDLLCVIVGGAWGDGRGYEERVRRYAAARCGERVVFLGPRNDIARIYADLDVAVHPSHSENLGGAAESMSVGVPTVATSVGGFPDLIEDGVTGWLVPARNPVALATAIVQAIADPDASRDRACKGQEVARRLLDVRTTAADVAAAYRAILATGAGS